MEWELLLIESISGAIFYYYSEEENIKYIDPIKAENG